MRRAKSIDGIYEEVRGCGLVVTNDETLATALNNLADAPTVGPFAMTPQQIASAVAIDTLGQPIWSKLKVVMTISEETGLDFRTVHNIVQYIEEVRRYTRDVKAHLYSKEARSVYDSYIALPTMIRAMEDFDADKSELYHRDGAVAVIGNYIDGQYDGRFADLGMFSDLEKNFIPPMYQEVQIYEGAEDDPGAFVPFDIDTIYQVGNDRQLAENAVALIDIDNSTDYAIVMKTDSPLADAVRAELYRKGIPFINDLSMKDLNNVRDYIRFISLSLSFDTIRVGDVRELFSSYGLGIPSKIDRHLLNKEVFSGKSEERRLLMKDIKAHTFDQVRSEICKYTDGSSVKNLIDDLRISDRKITGALLARLAYAVDNICELRHSEPLPENERRGVLLADCSNSMYVDRPVVIYLGMEREWNLELSNKRYVDDKTDESRRGSVRLEVLLQQGQRRFYLINTSKDGEEPRPCFLFDDIIGKPAKRFSDICPDIRRCSWIKTQGSAAYDPPVSPESPEFDSDLSQSAISQYLKCPMAYMFHSLVDSEDNENMEFGNIVHEFAELYSTHKEIVEAYGFDYFVDRAYERYSGISTPLMGKLDSLRIRCAMQNVKEFIDMEGITRLPLDRDADPRKNFFFGCVEPPIEKSSTMCEDDKHCSEIRLHGKMDLCANGKIIDFKTGGAKSGRDIVRAMDYENPAKIPDVQPLVYLTIGRRKGLTKGEFDLFYALDMDTECTKEEYDVKNNVRKVSVTNMSDLEFLKDSRVAEAISNELAWNSNFKKDIHLFVNTIADTVQGPVSEWPSQEGAIASAVCNAFGRADGNPVRNAIRTALKVSSSSIAATDKEVLVMERRLDDFVDRMNEAFEDIRRMSKDRFLCDPKISCRDCDYFDLCTGETVEDEGAEADD